MGTDKALIEVDGVPLARRVANALRAAGADPVIAVGGDLEALERAGPDASCPDRHPGEGPLGGILTALAATTEDVVVVLACDLPAADADTIRAVALALGDADVAAPWHDGRHELLHAAYHRRAEPVLRAAFDAGERAPHRAVADLVTWWGSTASPADGPRRRRHPRRPAVAGHPWPDGPDAGPAAPAPVPCRMDVPEIDVAELARQREAGVARPRRPQPRRVRPGPRRGRDPHPSGRAGRAGRRGPHRGHPADHLPLGARSLQAAEWLRGQGIDAVNVAGGMLAWIDAGLEIETGGAPT